MCQPRRRDRHILVTPVTVPLPYRSTTGGRSLRILPRIQTAPRAPPRRIRPVPTPTRTGTPESTTTNFFFSSNFPLPFNEKCFVLVWKGKFFRYSPGRRGESLAAGGGGGGLITQKSTLVQRFLFNHNNFIVCRHPAAYLNNMVVYDRGTARSGRSRFNDNHISDFWTRSIVFFIQLKTRKNVLERSKHFNRDEKRPKPYITPIYH